MSSEFLQVVQILIHSLQVSSIISLIYPNNSDFCPKNFEHHAKIPTTLQVVQVLSHTLELLGGFQTPKGQKGEPNMKKMLIFLTLLASSAAFAQTNPAPLKKLQQEARTLTLLSRLSAEDQEKFKNWQASRKEVMQQVKDLRTRALQAYTDALKNQKSVAEARLLAQKAVIDDQIALSGKINDLRATQKELFQKYPFLVAQGHKHAKSKFKKQDFKQKLPHQKNKKPI